MTSVDGPDRDERRRALLHRVRDRREELARELVEHYRTVIADYRELPEIVLTRDVFQVAVQNIEHMLDSFASGFDVSGEPREWLRRSATRRVHQHISLPSLLRTFRIWGQHMWAAIEESAGDDPVSRDIALQAASAVMAYVDELSTGVTQAYLHESADIAVSNETLRGDVLETLLGGEPVTEWARHQIAVLRINLTGRVLVIVVRPDTGGDPAEVRSAVDTIRSALGPLVRTCLIGVRDTEVVCLCSADATADVDALGDACDSLVARLGWIVGIGRPSAGLDSVARSYAEAREAITVGRATGRAHHAIRFPDVLLDQILRSTDHAEALLDETIQPLVGYDRDKNAELLPTLRAYVEANFNLTKAATRLTVNPNTVVYRLRRIHALSGRDPAAANSLILLALGLRLYDSSPPLP